MVKYFLLLFSVITIFLACKTSEKISIDNVFLQQYNALKNDKKFNEQLSILEGNWLNTTYIQAIKNTNSLYNADYEGDFLSFDFNRKHLIEQGKIQALLIHEGDDFFLEYNAQDQIFTNVLKEYESENESFIIRIKDENNIELFYKKTNTIVPFQKIKKDFNTVINDLLITGNYIGEREYGKVEFFANGKLQGIEKFKYYRLIFDYMEDYIQGDMILFNEKDNFTNWLNTRAFAIEYFADKIQLREVILSPENIEFQYKSNQIIVLNKN